MEVCLDAPPNLEGLSFAHPFSSIDSFVVITTLGYGKFGCVKLVQNRVTSQYCALKVLSKSETIRLRQVEHARSEREVLLLSNHVFLTKMYSTFADENFLYFCLEFCTGGELFKLLREVGRFNQKTTAFYAGEVCLGFEYLHKKNIAYRDLKPENVLIGADGHIKLCDFGFAKYIPDRSWTLCGTPDYLPPEMILGQGHDKSVDWWAFGVFIFELLAGYPPFTGDSPIAIYDKILDGIEKVTFPRFFTKSARDIITKLLRSRSRRLGNLVGGVKEVKEHPFFGTLDWQALGRKEVEPPALPNEVGEGDWSQFAGVKDIPTKFTASEVSNSKQTAVFDNWTTVVNF